MAIGPVGVLQIVFIVLKLTGTITWSWWWVLAPLWISGIIGLISLFFVGLAFLICNKQIFNKRGRF